MKRVVSKISALEGREKKRLKRAKQYKNASDVARAFEKYTGELTECCANRHHLSQEEVEDLCEASSFHPISWNTKFSVYNRARRRIQEALSPRKACAICDRGFQRSQLRRCRPEAKTAERWQQRLKGSDDVPRALPEYYSVKGVFHMLEGALVSRRGLDITQEGRGIGLLLCQQCFSSLKSRTSRNPPKFAITNGFDIGVLPRDLADSRSIERRMTSMLSVAHSVTVLKGGKHRSMKGHVSFIRMDAQSVAKKLPKLLRDADEVFLVIMTGKFTPDQEVLTMKRHEARVDNIRRLLDCYARNNALYKASGFSVDENALNALEKNNAADVTIVTPRTAENIRDEVNGSLLDSDRFDEIGEKPSAVEESSQSQYDPSLKEESSSIPAIVEDETLYSEKASISSASRAQTSVEVLKQAANTVVVRNGITLVSDYYKDILGLAFPELFPYGRGHAGTTRPVPVSFQECCRYYLPLSGREFAQHQSFLLIAFDIRARHQMVSSTCVRSRCRPGEFEEIGKVTETELFAALKEQRKQREDAKMGRSRNLTGTTSRAQRLLKQVRVSQANMSGSREKRLVYRRQAFSMDAIFKTGAIFLTITPTEEGTLQIAAIPGRVRDESIRPLEEGKLPDHAFRKNIASLDPVACCEYFENVCETFIEDVAGFDVKCGLPFAEGGLPRTVQEFSSKCHDTETGDAYKRTLCDLVDSILQTSLLLFLDETESLLCPACGGSGTIIAKKKVSEVAFKKQAKGRGPKKTSVCTSCNTGFGGCQVLRAEVNRLHASLDNIIFAEKRRIPMGNSHEESDKLTLDFCANRRVHLWHLWPPENESENSEIGRLHRLFISRIALLTQQHNYRHVDSCFKASAVSRNGHCRYGFPRPSGFRTHFNEELCLVLGRKEHNEYINGYNDVIAALFHTNHDIRFLLGGTTDALYYVMKYVTKAAEQNLAVERAIISSYERRARIERESPGSGGESPATSQVGRARVNSMAIAISKMQDVPASLCALYSRRKTAFYVSHGFSKRLLAQSMAIVEQDVYETELVRRDDGSYVRAPQHVDYTCRPNELGNVYLFQFVSEFKRVLLPRRKGRGKPSSSENSGMIVHRFLKTHPLQGTHGLAKRVVPVIPEIVGPPLPNIDELETPEQKEKYGMMALILFSPFRNRDDLRDRSNTF